MLSTPSVTEATPRPLAWQPGSAGPMGPFASPPRTLRFDANEAGEVRHDHDAVTKARVAQRLSDFLGYAYDESDQVGLGAAASTAAYASACSSSGAYMVPTDTLVGLDQARRLGISSVEDFFGGVVPHGFAATKLISHGLVSPAARAPEGWSHEFARRTRSAVLPGYSVFSSGDALLAGELMLDEGPVRVKHPFGVGGRGQWVVRNRAELQARLSSCHADEIREQGLVIERNLHKVVTHSVGQVQAGRLTISYHGTQSLTTNHRGHEVYGGSTLHVSRGTLDDLLRQDLEPAVHQAVEQAAVYHHAAMDCFRGMFASRCNYDVAQGLDSQDRWVSGVLEQSWRIGGASGAEVAALHALGADPGLQSVTASTCELYADNVAVPAGAWLLYDGDDPKVGRLTKYAQVRSHVHD
ncbi:MAG TPA: DUF3182 family protein [Rubrivivax sp.]|nr:DUF3182 family protein [Rubrivivax sp.]